MASHRRGETTSNEVLVAETEPTPAVAIVLEAGVDLQVVVRTF